MKNKVLIFGGSFDPIHQGHLNMLLKAHEGYNFKKIIIVPTGSAPLKDDHFLDANGRFKLVQVAMYNFPLKDITEISRIEIERSGPSYTIDTLKELCNNDDEEYYYLIGGDQLNSFEKWRNPQEISELVHLICLNRSGYALEPNIINKYNITVIEDFNDTMSSSDFRSFKNLDVPFDVLDYIYQKRWYWGETLFQFLQEGRYQHCFNVARIAANIVISNNFTKKISVEKCYRTALLHDIGKYFVKPLETSLSETINLASIKEYRPLSENIANFDVIKYNKDIIRIAKKVPKNCVHAFSGEILARAIFNQDDSKLLQAIRFHCTGNKEMTLLDKIIYCADKVDVRIGREGSDEAFRRYKAKNNFLEKELYRQFDHGFQLTIDANITYILKKNDSKAENNDYTDGMVRSYCSEEVFKMYFHKEGKYNWVRPSKKQ